MRIAFTAKGTEWNSPIDERFGRTEYLVIYDEDKGELTSVNNTSIENEAHGAGPKTAQKLFELSPDVLITGNGPGGNAASVLEKANIDCYVGAAQKTIKEAYNAYKNNKLSKF